MVSIFKNIILDKAGMSISLICAIHCFSFPLILSANSLIISVGSFVSLNETFEYIMWGASFFLAAFSFQKSFLKEKYYYPFIIFVISLMIFFIHKVLFPAYHQYLMPLIGLLLIWAHWLNYRFERHKKARYCKVNRLS